MDLERAEMMAKELIAKHVPGWQFIWCNAKTSVGWCQFNIKTIALSKPLTAINSTALIRDTVLHEIAHALVGPSHGHDDWWKMKCLQVGARPERCCEAKQPPCNKKGTCPTCKRFCFRYRTDNRAACPHCLSKIIWTTIYRPKHR